MKKDLTKDEINNLKEAIKDGWAMAHDPLCSKGFQAANEYIKYLEMTIADLTDIMETALEEYL